MAVHPILYAPESNDLGLVETIVDCSIDRALTRYVGPHRIELFTHTGIVPRVIPVPSRFPEARI